MGEGGLAESGRSVEKDVFDWVAAFFRGVYADFEIPLDLFLADVFAKALGAEGGVERGVVFLGIGGGNYGHRGNSGMRIGEAS